MIKELLPLDSRIPEWNLGSLSDRSCPICNSSDANVLFRRPDRLIVRCCKLCSTLYVSPSPSEDQLQIFYRNYDENHRRVPKKSAEKLFDTYNRMNPFSDLRIRELQSLVVINGLNILDIGFGRARFLYSLKKLGATAYGLELDPQAIGVAKFLGIDHVFQGSIDDFVSETKFSIISLLDLIEHPLNPISILRKSVDLLEEEGLLIIWTPNGYFERFEDNPITFRVDLEHMQYLTSDACAFIASELNLRIIHLETLGFPDLKDIDKPLSVFRKESSVHENHKLDISKVIKAIPGFSALNNFRTRHFANNQTLKPDERQGTYHLFSIMQKKKKAE